MDGSSFDQLSRRVASLNSRRHALKALTAVVVATIAGGRATTAAQSCTAQYRPCQSDGQCCAGAVCQSGMCMPGCRIGGSFVSASTPQPGNPCARCTPAISTTAWSPANEGMACWSGATNLCGGPSSCQSGVCQASSAVTCQPLTACHVAGECNPNTGLCSNPPAAAGTPCGMGETCISGFHSPGLTCNGAGACVAGQTAPCAPYVCGETACRTDCDDDAHCAAGAVCRERECVYLRENGASCPADHHCRSGHCVTGICCDAACEAACETCATGTCRPVVCDDELSCTTDNCDEETGNCVHTHETSTNTCLIDGACYNDGDANPVDPCQLCNAAANLNEWTVAPLGTLCGDATCHEGVITRPQCDANGACMQETTTDCWPYACDAASVTCRTSCTSDDQCVNGMVCNVDGACVCPPFRTLFNRTCINPCFVPGACAASCNCLATYAGEVICWGGGFIGFVGCEVCSTDADCAFIPGGNHRCLDPGFGASLCNPPEPFCGWPEGPACNP